jgi:putative transposase
VDTLGLLLKVVVHEGNVQDRDGAIWLLLAIVQYLPRLQIIWADAAFRGKFIDWVKQYFDIAVEIVSRDAQVEGFQLLSWRWIVERTFAWLYNYRRLSKDYEYHLQSSEAMIYAAMTHLMVRRLAKLEAPT